ncbi:branched-chain amino acid ABC transporter permease [Desulforamulus ferrireducens]|uniref:Branched-chain amino acid ABC transporter permease n=1 Tax=Desulforamulus ferrireducens TaxID=1833852 RepID=A0A1S6J0K2_9FIRM|nr:branched-chain amino acid ABC transporter permease [Desulforamulus ferrireducens]AQS60553.1 branched-chain amino acid ABC transporter permease [Desulforamulus ferrireducens]
MEVFIQQLINGISLGSIYALIALGYTMVYGIVKLINFAHGDIYMVGAYLGFFAIAILGWPFLPSLLLAMVVCSMLGMIIEKLAYKPLRNSPRITALITAIGVSLFLEYSMMLIVKPEVRSFPPVLTDVQYKLFGSVVVSSRQLIILVVTLALMMLLQYIVHKTMIGKAMRAVSHDKQAAQLMGINVDNTISFTFAIGSALAAAAGVLVGIYYNAINPLMGIMPGLKAFVAAVLGGIGIIPGAMTGGFLLGIVEAMVSGYGKSLYRDPVAFVILIIILIVKPAGLFGKNVREKV